MWERLRSLDSKNSEETVRERAVEDLLAAEDVIIFPLFRRGSSMVPTGMDLSINMCALLVGVEFVNWEDKPFFETIHTYNNIRLRLFLQQALDCTPGEPQIISI